MSSIPNYTQSEINAIVHRAKQDAAKATQLFIDQDLKGKDQYPCGFAWVSISGIKGSTKLGKMLKAAGVYKNDYEKVFQMWNPAGTPFQNMYAKEVGAEAAARVFRQYGFTVYIGSRMD